MNGKTKKLISPERAKEIIDCYGANSDFWPIDEKDAALSLIQHSEELRNHHQGADKLDQLLASSNLKIDASNVDLQKRIVESLPEQDKASNPLYSNHSTPNKAPAFVANKWVGMVAASIVVVVMSMSIVELRPVSIERDSSSIIKIELESWMWEQVAEETENDDEEPLSMMAFLEMDVE
jgi:hypothetical protein